MYWDAPDNIEHNLSSVFKILSSDFKVLFTSNKATATAKSDHFCWAVASFILMLLRNFTELQLLLSNCAKAVVADHTHRWWQLLFHFEAETENDD